MTDDQQHIFFSTSDDTGIAYQSLKSKSRIFAITTMPNPQSQPLLCFRVDIHPSGNVFYLLRTLPVMKKNKKRAAIANTRLLRTCIDESHLIYGSCLPMMDSIHDASTKLERFKQGHPGQVCIQEPTHMAHQPSVSNNNGTRDKIQEKHRIQKETETTTPRHQ